MANTLTNLIPSVYRALDVVSRELSGFILAVARDSTADRVAANQTLYVPIAPANTAGTTISPAMSIPALSDQTIGTASLTMANSKAYPFSWSGEETYSMNAGPGFLSIKEDQIAQAMRAAVNDIETSIFSAAYIRSSRGYGSAATTPFGTAGDYTDAANVRRILDDNGAPPTDRHLVINTAAGANLRGKQAQVHMSGTDSLLRQGVLFDINGFTIRESAAISSHTIGTASGAKISGVVHAVGSTTLTLASTGTGTLVSGDIVSFANDSLTYKYCLYSGDADVSNGGTFVLNNPGTRTTLTSASAAITVTASYTPNLAFSRNAILLATRLPALPEGGDLADDRMTITDPRTGLSFELASYPGYRAKVYHLSVSWGVAVLKSEHIATLIG